MLLLIFPFAVANPTDCARGAGRDGLRREALQLEPAERPVQRGPVLFFCVRFLCAQAMTVSVTWKSSPFQVLLRQSGRGGSSSISAICVARCSVQQNRPTRRIRANRALRFEPVESSAPQSESYGSKCVGRLAANPKSKYGPTTKRPTRGNGLLLGGALHIFQAGPRTRSAAARWTAWCARCGRP